MQTGNGIHPLLLFSRNRSCSGGKKGLGKSDQPGGRRNYSSSRKVYDRELHWNHQHGGHRECRGETKHFVSSPLVKATPFSVLGEVLHSAEGDDDLELDGWDEFVSLPHNAPRVCDGVRSQWHS